MEQFFEDQPCAIVVDDILVWGCTAEEHYLRLRQLMNRICAVNLKLNLDKCRFQVCEVTYVGHLLADQGIKPNPTKTDAVSSVPTPADKHDV